MTKGGKVTATNMRELSADGKVLTITSTGTTADRQAAQRHAGLHEIPDCGSPSTPASAGQPLTCSVRAARLAPAPVRYHARVTTLVRPEQPADDLDRLRARVAELEAVLDERAADADRISRELDMFAARYRQQVGTLHEQLDQLELDIAEADSASCRRRSPKAPAARASATPSPAPPEPAPRFTSDAVRKLFRDVARAIHPDLARDEHARDRRHALMIEANRAYALGDAEQLRRILESWERSPEAVQGSDPAAMRLRLERRLAQIEEHLELTPAIWPRCRPRRCTS